MSSHNKIHTNKDSTTKAGWLWQALHTKREFSAGFVNAAVGNDRDAMISAFELIDLMPEDIAISEAEFSAFAQGLTPSGELEVTAWEGYYVTDPLPSGDIYALLISSYDNRAYWGLEEGFIDCYSECEVDYYLGPHATLYFPSSAGKVMLSFSRFFDERTGRVNMVNLTGTVGDTPISGSARIPSLPRKSSLLSRASFSKGRDSQDAKNFFLGEQTKTLVSVLSLVTPLIAVIVWRCPDLRHRSTPYSAELKQKVNENAYYLLRIKRAQLLDTYLDLACSHDTLKKQVTEKLTERLQDAEFDKEILDQIIEKLHLKQVASSQLKASIQKYLKDRLKRVGQKCVGDLVDDAGKQLKDVVPGWADKDGRYRAGSVMAYFGEGSSGIQAIVTFVTLESRKEFYQRQVQGYTSAIEVIDQFITDSEQNIADWKKRAQGWRDEAERLKQEGKMEQSEMAYHEANTLDVEIELSKEGIVLKQKERAKIEESKKEAKRLRDLHDGEIKEWSDKWDKEVKDHIKTLPQI